MNFKILIVEDDPTIQTQLKTFLRETATRQRQ